MRWTNIKKIMDKLTRHPLMEDIPFETVVDYAVDFIRIVGTPASFEDKVEDIEIHNYRGELPCDFYEMTQVRVAVPKGPAIRYTTDSFHLSRHKNHYPEGYHKDLTYKIQGNCIFTSPMKEGKLELAYKALPIDSEGYPLIPDNSSYSKALELYIKKEWFGIQFDLGKISMQVMNKAEQDYAFAVGQCCTDMIRPTIDQMESITAMWNSLIDRPNHKYGFTNEGTREHIIIH